MFSATNFLGLSFLKSILIVGILAGCFSKTANADFILGDVVTASLIRTPGNASFDPTAISGTATVVDPGVEFQGQAFAIGSSTTDAFIDIDDGILTIGLFRTDDDTTSSGVGIGGASTLTWTISDIDSTGNDIELEFLEAVVTNDSSFGNDPSGFGVTTTSSSIQIDWTGGGILQEGGSLTVRYAVSSVPEPTTGSVLMLTAGVLLLRRRRV